MRSVTEPFPGPPGKTPVVPRLLAGLVLLVCRAPRLVLTVVLVSLALSVWLACTRLDYHTHRDDLMSRTKEVQQRWRAYLQEFGQDDDMVVVVQGGGVNAHGRMTEALEALAGRIRTRPEHFDRLFYKVDLRHLRDRALLFLSSAEISRIQNDLTRMRPLLDNPIAWKLFSLRGMVTEANGRLSRLAPGQAPAPEDVALLEQLHAIARSARASLDNPARYRNPWSGLVRRQESKPGPEEDGEASPQDLLARPQYFLSGDGQLAFLLVRPVSPPREKDFRGSREAVEALRALVEEVRPSFGDLKMGVTGLPVLNSDEMVASQSDTAKASWLALAGVALLYLVVFRNWRAPLLTVSTLLVGTVWALGWLTLTVGHLNLLSATFAVMLIGLGDYGVLWVTRYRQERSAGHGPRASLRLCALEVGPSILTAGVTTGLAFYAAMLADFEAVAELGWIAGSGVLLCALACFTVLPALIMLLDGRRELQGDSSRVSFPAEHEPVTFQAWLPGLARRPRAVLAGGLVGLLLLGIGALRVRYDHNLLNLQAESLDSVKWERTLINHTAGASWHALSHTDSREDALKRKELFEKLPEVSRVVEVASLVPSDQQDKLPRLHDIHARLAQLPPRHAPIRPLPSSPPILVEELQKFAALPFFGRHGEAFGKVSEELSRLARQLDAMPLDQGRARLHLFEQRVLADLCEDLHRLRDVSRPEPIELAHLPESLRERYVSPSGRWLLRVFGKESLWDYEALSDFVSAVQTVDAEATGKPFTTLEGLRAMKLGFQWAGVYALLAIVVVLYLDFRSIGPVLLALVPLLMAAVMALGLLGLFGFTLNPANMIALPLIVGVAVDNGVHVLHDYLGRKGRTYQLRRSTGVGILVAGLTTMLGFGTLILSSHRGLCGLGLILALGVGCSLLTSLVLLPATLQLWSRRQSSVASVAASKTQAA